MSSHVLKVLLIRFVQILVFLNFTVDFVINTLRINPFLFLGSIRWFFSESLIHLYNFLVIIIRFYLSIHSLPVKKIFQVTCFPDNAVRCGICPQVATDRGGQGKQINGPLQYSVLRTILLRMEWDDGNKYIVLKGALMGSISLIFSRVILGKVISQLSESLICVEINQ